MRAKRGPPIPLLKCASASKVRQPDTALGGAGSCNPKRSFQVVLTCEATPEAYESHPQIHNSRSRSVDVLGNQKLLIPVRSSVQDSAWETPSHVEIQAGPRAGPVDRKPTLQAKS